MLLLEKQGIKQVVATFHLRHPSDLRLATPQSLINLIEEYDGPVKISLMPEANMVFRRKPCSGTTHISHDIAMWKRMNVQQTQFRSLLEGWIVSAHFTVRLGWTKNNDADLAREQTYELMSHLYCRIMYQGWLGWIGHPFQWCVGDSIQTAIRRLLSTAVQTGHIVEIPIKPVRKRSNLTIQDARESIPMFQPEIIAEFGAYAVQTGVPLVAISLEAHHLCDLQFGLEKAYYIADWLASEGVRPEQIWGWRV